MKKRIALVGNMNNSFFAITRHLRDAGYDAHLFYSELHDHFEPKSDTFDLNYTKFCFQVEWLRNGYFSVDTELVKRDLQNFDIYIGQGDDAAIASKAGIQFDIYFPYGSDFYKYAWLPQNFGLSQRIFMKIFKKTPLSKTSHGTLAKFIRKAIVEAKNVFLDYTNEETEKKLLDLGLKGNYRNIPMPFIYYPQYENKICWDVHWKTPIDQLRNENEFIVLYHGRQEWKTEYKNNEFTGKNTHHLILGFADFLKNNPSIKTLLVLLEYGGDVVNSRMLIDELGISNNVVWFPKMYRKDLMYLIKNVDVCSGEFKRSYLTFGTVIEAMLMCKPVIHYREDELYKEFYKELYPLYNAREPEKISQELKKAFFNPEERLSMGKDAHDWVIKYFINNGIKKIIETIGP